jgi:hypothetical protein
MSPASSKKTSYAFNTSIQTLPWAWLLPSSLERSKNHICQNPEKTQNLHLISNLLSTTGKLFEKLILRIIQKLT